MAEGSRSRTIERDQRFLIRRHISDILPLILRESRYHRDHWEPEDLPGKVLWHWDSDRGELVLE